MRPWKSRWTTPIIFTLFMYYYNWFKIPSKRRYQVTIVDCSHRSSMANWGVTSSNEFKQPRKARLPSGEDIVANSKMQYVIRIFRESSMVRRCPTKNPRSRWSISSLRRCISCDEPAWGAHQNLKWKPNWSQENSVSKWNPTRYE